MQLRRIHHPRNPLLKPIYPIMLKATFNAISEDYLFSYITEKNYNVKQLNRTFVVSHAGYDALFAVTLKIIFPNSARLVNNKFFSQSHAKEVHVLHRQ